MKFCCVVIFTHWFQTSEWLKFWVLFITFLYQEVVEEAAKHGQNVINICVPFAPTMANDSRNKKAVKFPKSLFSESMLQLVDNRKSINDSNNMCSIKGIKLVVTTISKLFIISPQIGPHLEGHVKRKHSLHLKEFLS